MNHTPAYYITNWKSPGRTSFRQHLIEAFVIIGIWGIIAVFYSLITTITMVSRGEHIKWIEEYGFELLCIWPWMIATPIIFKVAQRYRFRRQELFKSILVHLSLAMLIFTVHSVNQSLAVHWFFNEPIMNGYIINDFIFFFNTRFALYAGVVLLAYLLEFYKKNHDSRLDEAEIKRQLSQAKFDAIKHRIQPLFVLRTLDAIEERMEHDTERADKMIADFSELLRIMLDQRGVRLILLEDDFHVINLYVQLLNNRFDLQMDCITDVDGKSAQAAIPYGLYLVSVFEFLAKNHLEQLRNVKKVYYQASAAGSKMELKVLLTGLHLDKDEIRQLSREANFEELNMGFQTLYNTDYLFEVRSDEEEGGFVIDLMIPFINYTNTSFEQGENAPAINEARL